MKVKKQRKNVQERKTEENQKVKRGYLNKKITNHYLLCFPE